MQSSFSTSSRKSMKFLHDEEDNKNQENLNEFTSLIPGLPNHLSQQCLSYLPPSLLYSVCKSWRQFIYSPYFPPFYSLYALSSPRSNHSSNSSSTSLSHQEPIQFFCLNPFSSIWEPLPNPPLESSLNLLRHHPSFISRNFPIQSITASGRLLLIAASTHNLQPAFRCSLGFDPLPKKWFLGPPLVNPRRWCITGAVNGSIYVASGIGSGYQSDVAKSLEKWDMKQSETEWKWEKMEDYKDGRFCREATEAIGLSKWDKLCMVNVKGNARKAGAVYNAKMSMWEEMPAGMLSGWTGPAAVEEEGDVVYVVDETKGALRRYHLESDNWEELIVAPHYFRGVEQVAAGRGRVCVVCAGGGRIVVVDVVARPVSTWVVNPPEGMEVVAVHILPRMCEVESN
ncbi:hypothetical protein Leryth_025414 [Lithospermum erythrorhizon]|nr:hypothetical protein Leryth_025414 [Lithospermum erythrorhizon]